MGLSAPQSDHHLDDQRTQLRLLGAQRQRYLQPSYQFAKRLLDVLIASSALLALAPLFTVIALVTLLREGRPVFFRQPRVGRMGKPFLIYKFRTMVSDADRVLERNPELKRKFLERFKVDDDPRITPLGKLLRKTSLDELPQLINVLEGTMAIVGPRPIVEAELEKYGRGAQVYLQMKPGCAGWWQCQGRSDTTYEERVALDTEYFDRASLRFDLTILIRTLRAMLSGRGAR